MANSTTNVLGTLFGLAFTFLYVAGSIHSCNKHKDDEDIVRYSPFAVYRGAEMFWHDDFKGVDWERRQKEDAFILFQMMTTPYGEAPETVNAEIDKFREKIKGYPKSRVNFLKNSGRVYSRFISTVNKEIRSYLDSLEAGLYQFNSKGWNTESLALEDSIITIYGITELRGASSQIDSTMIKIRLAVAFGDIKEIDKNRQSMGNREKVIMAWMNRVYNQIFDEPLK